MVDSISNPSSLNRTPSAAKESKSSENSALRSSFKSLSSGTSVSQASKDASVVVSVNNKNASSGQVGKIVDNLNEAVRFSEEALSVLEEVADEAGTSNESGVVREFAEDLTRLKSDIVELLSGLRNQAGTAEVIDENFRAADIKLEDVEKAQAKAKEAGAIIQFNEEQALSAHGDTLTPESVARLLSE